MARRWISLSALHSLILTALLTPARWALSGRSDYQLTWLARRAGALFWCLFPKRRALGLAHLRLALGESLSELERRQILRDSYTHLALTVLSALKRACTSHSPDVEVQISGRARLNEALQRGGVVFVSAHMGDWEQLLTVHQQLDRALLLLSKRFRHPLAQAIWDRSRARAPVRLDRGERAKVLVEHLRRGGCVADVIDQHDPRAKARRVPFFGREAMTSPDAITLAERGGASIVPLLTWRAQLPEREGDQVSHIVWVGEPIYLQEERLSWTQKDELLLGCIKQIEDQIKQRPEQWMWIHRRWKSAKATHRSTRPSAQRNSG